MAVTVAALSQAALRELNEATNSSAGEVGDGAGAATVTTTTTLYDYLTQALVDWCETAWPLFDSATLTWTSASGGTQNKHALTAATYARLWRIRAMAMGATPAPLERISLAALKANKPNYEFEAAGTPLYFWEEGNVVGVYPAPSTNLASTFHGLAVPLPAGSGSGGTASSYSFAPDDVLLRVIPVKAAILLAEKLFDDPSVYGRVDHLRARYLAYQMEYRGLISPEILGQMRDPAPVRRK
jgi:hypothetical protein